MSYKRRRSDCATEERYVDSYVESCVQFSSNVFFHDAAAGKQMAETVRASTKRQAVLLLGRNDRLKQSEAVKAIFPYYNDNIAKEIAAARDNKVHIAAITESVVLMIGKVTSTASRHNCPVRPDKIVPIIRGAIDQSKESLHVYHVGPTSELLCVAGTTARASKRNFSAKKGLAEASFLEKGVRIDVVTGGTAPFPELEATALSVQLCQRLVDAPTSLLDTTTFAEIAASWAAKLAAEGHNVSTHILEGEELRSAGYGGLYGTGKAAEYPPHLVTLSYKPKAGISPKEKIAFVGKGIVYDTGGLAIKPRDGMCTMKHDMGGAAAIFAAFVAMVRLGVPHCISCILCLADNAVGPRSQRNDDIILMKSGVTVEINNTDAEGRLVLSDGVFHASAELEYVPDIIVDMATLTGAQGIATGKHHAAIYANTEESERRFVQAGRASGDLCFPVVYCPELHNEEYGSEVADFRNSVKNRANAQVSCAGQFIGNNLSKDYKGEWVHVDLAGPATCDEATGYGVALLVEVFARNC